MHARGVGADKRNGIVGKARADAYHRISRGDHVPQRLGPRGANEIGVQIRAVDRHDEGQPGFAASVAAAAPLG